MRVLIFGHGGMADGLLDYFRGSSGVILHSYRQDEVDVRDRFRVREQIDSVNGVDWVINCAGIDKEDDPFNTIYTNLYGTLNVAQACGERGISSIHIASVAGLYGKPNHTAYCASKAGVISVVQSLGFTQPIWAISPGRVDTPMREAHYPNDTPGSRLEPQQIGRVVASIFDGKYEPGTNVIIRKVGLEDVFIEEHKGDGWRERLRVGQPVTI